jgi:hypothetical protein
VKNNHLEQQAMAQRAEAFKLIEQIKKIESVPPKGIAIGVSLGVVVLVVVIGSAIVFPLEF